MRVLIGSRRLELVLLFYWGARKGVCNGYQAEPGSSSPAASVSPRAVKGDENAQTAIWLLAVLAVNHLYLN